MVDFVSKYGARTFNQHRLFLKEFHSTPKNLKYSPRQRTHAPPRHGGTDFRDKFRRTEPEVAGARSLFKHDLQQCWSPNFECSPLKWMSRCLVTVRWVPEAAGRILTYILGAC